jgi:hypothetical protein
MGGFPEFPADGSDNLNGCTHDAGRTHYASRRRVLKMYTINSGMGMSPGREPILAKWVLIGVDSITTLTWLDKEGRAARTRRGI